MPRSPSPPPASSSPTGTLRSFIASLTSLNPAGAHTGTTLATFHSCAVAIPEILRVFPLAAGDAVLAVYASLADFDLDLHLRSLHDPRHVNHAKEAHRLIEDMEAQLSVLAEMAPPDIRGGGVPKTLAVWCLHTLGELSAKYASKVTTKRSGLAPGVNEALPLWLEYPSPSALTRVATKCLKTLMGDAESTEACVSVLLDTSVKHAPHFDWVVAHVGSCFPETVIKRVLAVGLKDFCHSSESQIKKDRSFTLSKVPKINSVVSILDHLACTHMDTIGVCLQDMITLSLQTPLKAATNQQVATVPYLLYLGSLSETLNRSLGDDLPAKVNTDTAEKISGLVDVWGRKYFPEDDGLTSLSVHLIICCEQNFRGTLGLLLDLGADKTKVSKAVREGCRLLLELILAEIQLMVHQSPENALDEIASLKSLSANFHHFLHSYLLKGEPFQQKIILNLLSLLSIHKGRTVAIDVVKYGLQTAESDADLGILLEFIRQTELFLPDFVDLAVTQSLSCKSSDPEPILRNVGRILQYQHQKEKPIQIRSDISKPVAKSHMKLLARLSEKRLIPDVIKIFHYVPLAQSEKNVSLLFRTAQCFCHTIFVFLEDDETFDEQEKCQLIAVCVKVLLDVADVPRVGMAMVQRFLMEAAINSPFAELLGGKWEGREEEMKSAQKASFSLLDENLKFGSMPTHPFGTSTYFHAGVIGDGKRRPSPKFKFTQERIDFNQFTFLSVLFRICQAPAKSSGNGERSQAQIPQDRNRSKEACKQLALLLVEMVSPDVMYNGLPWPEEEFIKVTMERDLTISKRFEDQPVLWKVMMSLAESRPALCYCSVLLRALLAVQMNYWQASTIAKAKDSPKHLKVTKEVLQLMSLGQYVPPPLNSVSQVLDIMHAFHVHCILTDIWNYMKDNVPSPVAFASNKVDELHREFEPYKNYKNYCERLRLIMLHHVDELAGDFKTFFIDVSTKQEEVLEMAMNY